MEVEAHRPVEVVVGLVRKYASEPGARIVDEDVDAPVGGDGLVNGSIDRLAVRNVAADEGRFAAVAANLVLYLEALRHSSRHDRDPGALPGEAAGGLRADSIIAARHDRNLALQFSHHRNLPCVADNANPDSPPMS